MLQEVIEHGDLNIPTFPRGAKRRREGRERRIHRTKARVRRVLLHQQRISRGHRRLIQRYNSALLPHSLRGLAHPAFRRESYLIFLFDQQLVHRRLRHQWALPLSRLLSWRGGSD